MQNQNLYQEIEEIVQKEVYRGAFQGEVKLDESAEIPPFEAHIELPKLEKIKISYNPEYAEQNPEKAKTIARDVSRHEINHRKYQGFNGCPRNIDLHTEKIVEPIAEVLKEKSYGKADFHYTANALEDTILHDDLNSQFCLDGVSNFFEEVGKISRTFTPFYEAHVKLNLFLWGNKKQKRSLGRYYAKDEKKEKEIAEVIKTFLEKTGMKGLSREQKRNFLNNEENWPLISKVYAEEFSKLMQPNYAMSLFNHSGEGTRGIPKEAGKEGNPFDHEMETPLYKKKRMQKAHSNNEAIPAWLDQFEALDLIYESLAQKLNVKAETYTKSSDMPIMHYGKRPFDPERDNLKHVVFGFNEEGKLELKKKRWHESIPLEYKVNPRGFPEMRLGFLDTSGSMQQSPQEDDNIGRANTIPWGDNSKYHYALLGWYGLLEYLKQNHLLKQTNISLANFGSTTKLAAGLAESKRLALNPQFSNQTRIEKSKVKDLFSKRDMLLFTISDGQIQNWDDIREDFIAGAKQQKYFHLQIGDENETTEDLRKAGLHVTPIKNANDIASTVIDLTDKLYRG